MSDLEERQDNPFRIERDAVPVAYRLRIEPDLTESTFDGTVDIDIELTTPTSKIILNAVELDFDEVMIHLGDHSVPSESIVFDETYETATIEFAAVFAPGRATLSIKFHGVLNEQLHGFWRSVRERWDEVVERFPSVNVPPMLSGVTTFAADAHLAGEVRAFHELHPLEVGQQELVQSLDAMDVNVALAQRNVPTLAGELRDFNA